MSDIDVTVVVCTYNRAALLGDALESLAALNTPGGFTYEVLVVDNGSTDDTARVVDKVAQRSAVPLRRVSEPRPGVACSRNRGVAEARGTWIAFFDDDQLADPQWLAELLDTARQRNARCVGGALVLRLPNGCRRELDAFCRGLLGEYAVGGPPQVYGRKAAANTGNLLLHRSIFEQVGRFDESLHAAGEDGKLYYFIRRAGVQAWYNPRALVHHVIPSYRLTKAYLKWTAQRHGWNSARLDYQVGGRRRVTCLSIARIGQTLCIHLPTMLGAMLCGDRERTLGVQCRGWRTVGHVRGALKRVFPRLLPQPAYEAYLTFRGERETFAQEPSDA